MELFARCDRETERLLAVTEEGKRYTLGDLNAAAERIAGAVGEHRLVFVLCENTPGTLLGYLGCLKAGEVPLLLLLDELQDPQNVGALIRTANAAGVHGVLLPQRRSCPLNGVVAKISAGAIEYVPVIQIGNIAQTMKQLKKRGFWIAGADMDGESQYFDANLTGPMVLVVGAEGKGLGRLVKENCDFIVRIPMLGQVSSLNASVAGGILLYDIVRQRILEGRKKP